MREKTKNNKLDPLIEKSERGLRSAKNLLREKDYDFCVSRAYYAMFHMTEAALLTKNIMTSKHSGLLTLFHEHFIKSGLFEKSLHQDLHLALELRHQGDYWADSGITGEMAEELLKKAERFIRFLKDYLIHDRKDAGKT